MEKMTKSERAEVRQFLKWKREQSRIAARSAFLARIDRLNHKEGTR